MCRLSEPRRSFLSAPGVCGGFGASPAYHCAKGAVRTLTKSTALAWAKEGVRVNSVHPGFIEVRRPAV